MAELTGWKVGVVVGLLFGLGVGLKGYATDEQTINVQSTITGATCDVEVDTPQIYFASVTPAIFTKELYATTGEVKVFNVIMKNCLIPGTDDPAATKKPSLTFSGDDGFCGNDACWRAADSTTSVGFLLANGDFSYLAGQKDKFFIDIEAAGALVQTAPTSLASAGMAAQDNQRYPFSLAMTCGECDFVGIGETHATMTIQFSYE